MLINGKMNYIEIEQLVYHIKEHIVGAYLKNIYHYDGRWLLKFNHFSFVYEPGIAVWPGTFVERETQLHSLSVKIRKEIRDHKVISFDIVEDDRTIVLQTPNHKIIFELYAKGNLILTDKLNSIIVLTRIYPECSHGKTYMLKDFKDYSDYTTPEYYWKVTNKEIVPIDNKEIVPIDNKEIVPIDNKEVAYNKNFDNILEAMSSMWNVKYTKNMSKSSNKLTSKRKKNKNSAVEGINNQINKFNSKINNKLEQLETLEILDDNYENMDFEAIGKLHQERKAIGRKLSKAIVTREEKEKEEKSKLKRNIKTEKKAEKVKLDTNSWYQKYHWWYTKNGFLVVGGRSATDNEKLVKSYLGDNDLYFHTDEPGSGSFILFTNNDSNFDTSKYMIDIDETAEGVIAFSNQWNTSCPSGEVFYVKGNQVTKSAPTGEYVGKGSFMIYGKKEFVKVSGTTLGYGLYNNKLMLAPYRIITRLSSNNIKLKPRYDLKKMKGKIITNVLKKKLNIEMSDDLYVFNKPCNVN